MATFARRRHEEIDQGGFDPGTADDHETSGAETGQGALQRKRSKHGCDRRVHGVSSLAQYPGAGLRRKRMPGGNDTARTHGSGKELGDVATPDRGQRLAAVRTGLAL